MNNTETLYYWDGDVLVGEKTGSDYIIYLYDVMGIAGMVYNNQYYYFEKNLFGDVIKVYNSSGSGVAEFKYDSYGNIVSESGSMADKVKMRYRSYYWDEETGFYYLQSRYYDPSICRFISADQYSLLSTLSSSLGELNLYAYCANNPIVYTDSEGKFAITLTVLGLITGAIIGAAAGGIIAYNIAKNSGAEGWELFGWTILGIVGGGVVGGALGAGVGAIVTKATGIIGLSITKYSIIPIKSVTVLGNMPGYISAATATGSGYYLISDQLWNSMTTAQQWANNMQYLMDASKLGSQFALVPDWVVKMGSTFWREIQYLIENGIPWLMF